MTGNSLHMQWPLTILHSIHIPYCLLKRLKNWAQMQTNRNHPRTGTGWPDWANIRPLGDCWLCVVLWKSQYFRSTLFHGKSYVIISTKKGWATIWPFFSRTRPRRILSPWGEVIPWGWNSLLAPPVF
jgi:hypothetical protein